jgi:fatty acid desaturase
VVADGHYVLALGLSFVFFLTGLRLIHNAFHSALGLSRRTTDVVLWIMSLLMLGSMHAVQFNHLRHHKLTLGEGDVEGRHADMPAWRGPATRSGLPDPPARHGTSLWQPEAASNRRGRVAFERRMDRVGVQGLQ